MREIFSSIANTFIPIFVAVDVFSIIPIFLALTEGLEMEKRKKIQRESIITAFLAGLAFIALGETVFRVLGVTENDFKIAGGLLLLVLSVSDLLGSEEKEKHLESTGVVPLGVPLIVGPAVLTTVLVLVDHYGIWATLASFVLNLILVWLAFDTGNRLIKLLGKAGIKALSKIMCLLLASIAIMMIRIGVISLGKGNL